jgi:hypothetical protein
MSEDDWGQVYFAFYNRIPLSDVPWRWKANKEQAEKYGHEGSCIKQPGSCGLCIIAECMAGGRQMAKAWGVKFAKEGEKE